MTKIKPKKGKLRIGYENGIYCNDGEMILCKKGIISWFQFICFMLAGYMGYLQLKTYRANQDMSITTYKSFQNEAQDIFPTFTICAVGKSWILSNEKMPQNHSAYAYSRILDGDDNDSMNYSKIRFDYVAIDVNKFISDYHTLSDEGIKVIRSSDFHHGQQNSSTFLEISHLDSRRVCVSKKDFENGSLLEKDYIEFNMSATILRLGFVDLEFYIHQKGQLLRQLKHPNFRLYGHQVRKSVIKHDKNSIGVKQEIRLKVVSVDVLRKRANSIQPCDPDLQNEDNKIRHYIIDAFGCIPAFTRLFLNQSLLLNDSNTYNTCNKSQYNRIYHVYGKILQTKEWYTQPCTTMNTIVQEDTVTKRNSFAFSITGSKPGFGIEFEIEYLTNSYRETVNKMAFDMATLWSQIGGFIGMFLGYSLLQVPELAENWYKQMFRTLFK